MKERSSGSTVMVDRMFKANQSEPGNTTKQGPKSGVGYKASELSARKSDHMGGKKAKREMY